MNKSSASEKWDLKKVVIVVGIFLVAIVSIIYLIIPKSPDYITAISMTKTSKDTRLPTFEIEQKGFDSRASIDYGGDIVYDTEKYVHVFAHDGFYKGKYFRHQYIDEENNVKMRISPNITPNDGIIESYMIVKIDYPKVVAKVFLDSDWKNEFGNNTYVLYGESFKNETKFKWNEETPGIYSMTIVQYNADDYGPETEYTPAINIAVVDRTRQEVYYTNQNQVTMVVYK